MLIAEIAAAFAHALVDGCAHDLVCRLGVVGSDGCINTCLRSSEGRRNGALQELPPCFDTDTLWRQDGFRCVGDVHLVDAGAHVESKIEWDVLRVGLVVAARVKPSFIDSRYKFWRKDDVVVACRSARAPGA